jgi:hypothetical protein
VHGAEKIREPHERKKQMDTEATTGQTVYGLVPARNTNFLVGEYYSLDRCPLMGTSLAISVTANVLDYQLKVDMR